MSDLLREALLFGFELVRQQLRGGSENRAGNRVVADILGEMVEEAVRQGVTSLTPEFREPFERRIVDAWRALGLLKGV